MGSFVSHVMVRGGSREQVRASLGQRMASDEMVPCGPDEADRTVILPKASAWQTVYDEGTEGQDLGELEAVCCALALGPAVAVGVIIHDSDVLMLVLAKEGKVLDRYNSAPSYFGRVSKKKRQEAAGKPEVWAAALGESVEAFGEVFAGSSGVFAAHEVQQRLVDLVGMDPELSHFGFRYYEGQEGDERLYFRHPPGALEREAGPPAFRLQSHGMSQQKWHRGWEQTVRVGFTSVSGPGVGVGLVAWGSALEQGLVRPLRARIRFNHEDFEASFETNEQGQCWARWPAFAMPEGVSMESVVASKPSVQQQLIKRMMAAQLGVNASVEVMKEGQGEVFFGLTPLENHPQGSDSVRLGIEVCPPLRRPLRTSSSPDEGVSMCLKQLNSQGYVVGMAVLQGAPSEGVFDHLADWLVAVPGEGSFEATLRRSAYDMGVCSVPAKAISGRWKKWRAAITGDYGLSLRRERDALRFDGGGVVRHTNTAPDEEVWVAYWYTDVAGRLSEVPEVVACAEEQMECLLATTPILQGFVADWDWLPEPFPFTPYERVAGICGVVGHKRSWFASWLRAVTARMWVGSEHDAYRATDPVVHGHAKLQGEVSELEERLAEHLPTAEDWLASRR